MGTRSRARERWLIVGVPAHQRFGREIRAHHVFSAMAQRRLSFAMHRPTPREIARLLTRHAGHLVPGTLLATTGLLPLSSLNLVRRLWSLEALDLHDHPVLQSDALGFRMAPGARHVRNRQVLENVRAFKTVLVPSWTFADLAEVPIDKRLYVPNGTDVGAIDVGAWPTSPVIGMMSGAAPGRGIEVLIDAVRLLRLEHPEATLSLALAPTDASSLAYLRHLTVRARGEAWLTIGTVPYAEIGAFMANAMVMVIPHPPHAYMDAALPVKLFDAMASGRPLCVTPRTETVRVVTEADAGVVARTDSADDIAEALGSLVGDARRSRELGANARRAAETQFDWSVLASGVASALLDSSGNGA